MSQKRNLTPKQQALMDFLDELAVNPITTEMTQRGYELLDLAAQENRELQEQIAQEQQQQGGQN